MFNLISRLTRPVISTQPTNTRKYSEIPIEKYYNVESSQQLQHSLDKANVLVKQISELRSNLLNRIEKLSYELLCKARMEK